FSLQGLSPARLGPTLRRFAGPERRLSGISRILLKQSGAVERCSPRRIVPHGVPRRPPPQGNPPDPMHTAATPSPAAGAPAPAKTPKPSPIKLSDRAAAEVKRIVANKQIPQDYGLRVGVKGGGCSGMSYVLGFDRK